MRAASPVASSVSTATPHSVAGPEAGPFEAPPEPAPRAGRIVLGAFLALFSLMMLAFWIYFAITS